jgi:hypothetical protein
MHRLGSANIHQIPLRRFLFRSPSEPLLARLACSHPSLPPALRTLS